MSVLNATGIVFGSDSTVLNSKYGIVPQGSRMVYFQASAPTGWAQVTTSTLNNAMMRVVSGTGGGTGGTTGFGSVFPTSLRPFSGNFNYANRQTSGYGLTSNQNAIHAHPGFLPSGAFGPSPQQHTHTYQFTQTQPNLGEPGPQPGPAGNQPLVMAQTNVPHSHNTAVGQVGNQNPHTHGWVHQSSSFSGQVDFRVQYIEVIVCSFS